jgi:hypothetical protein
VIEILWGPYQEHHITVRHGVTAEQFEEAWIDRIDWLVRADESYESVGATNDGRRYTWSGAGISSTPRACFPSRRTSSPKSTNSMPIRYTTDDPRTAEQVAADDRIREEIERTGGAWAQMSKEQRTQILARLRDKKQRAQAARARKQAEQDSLEERITKLEERVARLGG